MKLFVLALGMLVIGGNLVFYVSAEAKNNALLQLAPKAPLMTERDYREIDKRIQRQIEAAKRARRVQLLVAIGATALIYPAVWLLRKTFTKRKDINMNRTQFILVAAGVPVVIFFVGCGLAGVVSYRIFSLNRTWWVWVLISAVIFAFEYWWWGRGKQ